MLISLICFTKENEVIGLTNDDQLYSTISNLLITYTLKTITDFKTTEQMINHLKEYGINSTRLKVGLSELTNEED